MDSIRTAFLCCLLAAASFTASADSLTVDQAYSVLQHRRTVFDARATKASKDQVEGLKRLFSLAELGTILKVRAYQTHARGDKAGYAAVLKDYDALVEVSKRQAAAPDIKIAQDLVTGAIAEQRAVIVATASKPATAFTRAELARSPEVQKVHRDLIRAYNILMSTFPNEPAVNRNAFYDYLCALDFL